MTSNAAEVLLPTADAAWGVWDVQNGKHLRPVGAPSDVAAASRGGLWVGLPAAACRSIGLLLPTAPEATMRQMVHTWMERQGLATADRTRPYRWHVLGQHGLLSAVSVDVLIDPFPEALIARQAQDYFAALRFAQLPEGHVVLLEEQGDWVAAVGFAGQLFHSHLVGPREMDAADIATDLLLTRLTLEAQPGATVWTGVTLLGGNAELIGAVEEKLKLPVQQLQGLEFSHPVAGMEPLLPEALQVRRQQILRRRQWVRRLAMAAGLVLSLAFLAWAHLRERRAMVARLELSLERTEAPAERVKATAQRWKNLSPAVDSNRYPMLLLSEVTTLMPPSGIAIRQFEAKVDELNLRGDARDAQLAYQFLEDLQKHRVLGRFAWSMPQPTVNERNASFRAQGKLK